MDDLYEAFYNLPLLYMLGGDERFLRLAHFHWDAVNRQAQQYGLVKDEYELGYDQFHQSEGNLYFCLLCSADPENPVLFERARRFADLFLGMPNYDPDLNIIRAVHTGAGGPRWGYLDEGKHIWSRFMEPFALPFEDIEGIQSYEDLGDWNESAVHTDNRQRMMSAMNTRMGQGDSVCNLLATSLVTNAFLMTGDHAYSDWVLKYTQGWWDRAAENQGVIPDNVRLDGRVGAMFDGAWYGAAYGWTWPLGYDYVDDSLTVAAMNATLVSGSTDWLKLPGQHFDLIFSKGHVVDDYQALAPPRPDPWIVNLTKQAGSNKAFVAPKKRGQNGWFAEFPFIVGPLASRWCTSFDSKDAERLAKLEEAEPQDWSVSYSFRAKGDDGHERPWFTYVSGRNDSYPEEILNQSLDQVAARLAMVEADTADLTCVHIHHWQNHNPITTEALVQLTLGAPQQRYNGGFHRACFRYFDRTNNRLGLPPNVSALVRRIDNTGAELTLVNLHQSSSRQVSIQGGFFGEHEIVDVTIANASSSISVNGHCFDVLLSAATQITLRIQLKRFARSPSNVWPTQPREHTLSK